MTNLDNRPRTTSQTQIGRRATTKHKMYTSPIFKILLAVVTASDVAQATLRIRHAAEKRQTEDLSILPLTLPVDSTSTPISTIVSVPSTTSTVDEVSTEQTTATSIIVVSTTSVPQVSSTIITTPPPTTSSVQVATTSTTDSWSAITQTSEATFTWTSEEAKQTTTYTPVISTSVEVVTRTSSDGSKHTMTTSTLTTSTPGLNADGQGSGSGMPAKTRNTIIGVVVGIGGAIVLGALGLVAWRIWGRKRKNEENEAFMPYNNDGYTGLDKAEASSPGAGPQRSPFQSTLENYHQPTAGPVNASSNF